MKNVLQPRGQVFGTRSFESVYESLVFITYASRGAQMSLCVNTDNKSME